MKRYRSVQIYFTFRTTALMTSRSFSRLLCCRCRFHLCGDEHMQRGAHMKRACKQQATWCQKNFSAQLTTTITAAASSTDMREIYEPQNFNFRFCRLATTAQTPTIAGIPARPVHYNTHFRMCKKCVSERSISLWIWSVMGCGSSKWCRKSSSPCRSRERSFGHAFSRTSSVCDIKTRQRRCFCCWWWW